MTIKVISEQLTMIKECPKCHAVLEFQHSDTVKKMIYDYTGLSAYESFLECPVCNHDIIVTKLVNNVL